MLAAVQVFPAVDVLDGQVVRLHQGDYNKITSYSDDPIETAAKWSQAGAETIHLVDLDGARTGRPSPLLWAEVAGAGIDFQVGGGLRTHESVAAALEAGARRAVMGTAAVHDPNLVGELISSYGSDRIAVSIDIRGTQAQGAGWLDEGKSWMEVLRAMLGVGVSWIVTTAINRDGTMLGPDLALVEEVVAAAPGAKVVAAGGIGSDEDLTSLDSVGATGAIVGRALYEGAVSLPSS